MLLTAALVLVVDAVAWTGPTLFYGVPGIDFTTHRQAALDWLAGGGFYHARQLVGPYEVFHYYPEGAPILYPPTVIPLLAAFTVLPAVLWWAIPLAIIGWVVWRNRTPERLMLVLALALFPTTPSIIFYGNPAMWITAALALGTVWPEFVPLILVKPSIAPVALYRIRERGWWIGAAIIALVAIPFGHLWVDWLTALLNSRQDTGLLYSITTVPILLIPLAAVFGAPE